jgi:hypothetical protein
MSVERLTGQRVSAVTVVEDYIQIALDRCGITAIVDPVVESGGVLKVRGEAGYFDTLATLPGRTVVAASIVPNDQFRMTLDTGESLRISLAPDAYRFGPEALMVQHEDGSFDVW